ncbi:ras-associated protein 2-like isoform X2 [Oratosquilla oratoria]|uniref:ras-associated protein 2-like isoform X2 n=1 Tax=Oratosquilla oratoria TaxID=337810 RepID=UPI003F76341A
MTALQRMTPLQRMTSLQGLCLRIGVKLILDKDIDSDKRREIHITASHDGGCGPNNSMKNATVSDQQPKEAIDSQEK